MKLSALAASAGSNVPDAFDIEVSSLAFDSRAVAPGTLFFCVPGAAHDGHDFADAAVSKGAGALVAERLLSSGVPELIVDDARAAMAPIAAAFNGHPSRQLSVAAVTGTNGKTTTAWLLREILAATLGPCGLLGTVKRIVGGVEEPVIHTTPEAIDLQADLARMLASGDRACVLEASSHALELHRCDSIDIDVAVFTNLTQDHLDFHGDMDAYFAAKRRLFELGPAAGVVNLDDQYGRRLAEEYGATTYSAAGDDDADYRAEDVEFDAAGSRFDLCLPDRSGDPLAARIGLPGPFNVANALAAIGAAGALGVEAADAVAALAAIDRVPGRFEPVEAGQDFTVLVDYAHTPDSLDNVLRAARQITPGRLIAVFGAGGDRDRDKRPKMGRAGSQLADVAVLTSDNPRSEDPAAILEEVAVGCDGPAEQHTVVDRRDAIQAALGMAAAGDTVVIAGKGHERGQEFEAGRKIPFDDREVAREVLREIGGAERGTDSAEVSR